MSQDTRPGAAGCCGPSIKGLRRLTFPDGTRVGITGLDEVMERLYRDGRLADARIAADIMEELKSENYFAPSARPAYEELFSREYQRFLGAKSDSRVEDKDAMSNNAEGHGARKKGLRSLFKGGKKADSRGS